MHLTNRRTYSFQKKRRPKWLSFLFLGITVLFVTAVFFYLKNKLVHYDILITNATIHDGTKNGKAFNGGVGINNGRICDVWRGRPGINPRADLIIDAKGTDLSPGFIDTHSHADMSIVGSSGNIKADNFVGQGITTIISGNCGKSASDILAFAQSIAKRSSNINIATLIGLNTVRKKVMRESSAPANSSEIRNMCEIVRAGMKAGALGVSTGLAYPPGIFASHNEMIEQLKVAGELGGIHTTHMRSEGREIGKAVDEVIDLSREANIPLVISHYKITGLSNCAQFDDLQNKIAKARSSGMKISVDYYPYNASSTNLNILLPEWYLALDRKAKSKIMTSTKGRMNLKNSVLEMVEQEGFTDFKFATVAYYAPHREWQGKTLEEIGGLTAKTGRPIDSQLQIFLDMESHGGAQMVYQNICPDVMDRIPEKEENMIGTDSAIRNDKKEYLPHPRGWGAFPRFIRRYVQEKRLFTIDEAIYRMSGLPAEVFHLKDRGKIRKGYYADLVVFDSKSLKDRATYKKPYDPPAGIKYVIVNGKIVAKHTKAKNEEGIEFSDHYPGMFVQREE